MTYQGVCACNKYRLSDIFRIEVENHHMALKLSEVKNLPRGHK